MKWQIRFAASLLGSIGMASGLVLAGIGDLDPTYGNGGHVVTNVPTGALGDGSLIYPLAGATVGSTDYAHVDINGHPDPLFGGAGRLSLPVGWLDYPADEGTEYFPMALRTPAGQLLFSVLQNGDVSLLRLDATGHPDPSFGTAGIVHVTPVSRACVPTGTIVARLAFQPDGHLLTMLSTFGGGYDDDVLGSVAIRRFDGNGLLDPTFGNGAGVVSLVSSADPCLGGYEGTATLDVLQDGSMDIVMPVAHKYMGRDGVYMPGPPVSSDLRTDVTEWRYGGTLSNGDLLLINGTTPPSDVFPISGGSYPTTILARVHPDGTLDSSFGGAGTGYAELGVAALVSSETDVFETAQTSRISADGQHIYVVVMLVRQCGDFCANGATLGLAVVRLLAEGPQAGRLDGSFGHGGVVLLAKSDALNITDLIEQPGGAVVLTSDASAMRLLGDATRSPGMIGVAGDYFEVPTSEANAQVHVARTLGKDGAVSVSYAIGNSPGLIPNSDYTPVSGRLDWADGDFADKVITIPVFHQPTPSNDTSKILRVELTAPTGGASMLSSEAAVYIDEGAGPASTPPPPDTTPASGGGGSFGLGSLALLSLCFLMACARARRARA